MWYIFKGEKCIANSDFQPNVQDLATRNEQAIESEDIIPLHEVELLGSRIMRKQPKLPVLAELKQAKKKQINEERDRLEESGFLFCGQLIDSDDRSVQRLAVAAQAAQLALSAGQAYTVSWTCADNSTLILTAEQVADVVAALAQHTESLHNVAQQLKERVDDAHTAEQVQAIAWPDSAEC